MREDQGGNRGPEQPEARERHVKARITRKEAAQRNPGTCNLT
jgi:hypothetical protein